MNTIEKIGHWGDTHHPKWIDVIRMGLGVFLFYKGVQFGRNPQDLRALIEGSDFTLWTFFLFHYIPMVHIAGGILITIGLITRTAILFQLPVLLGAVMLTGKSTGMFDSYQFGVSFFALTLLIVFLIIGSGPFSADEHLKKHPGG